MGMTGRQDALVYECLQRGGVITCDSTEEATALAASLGVVAVGLDVAIAKDGV